MEPAPKLPEFLSIDAGFARFAPKAEATLEAAVEMIEAAIAFARESGIGGLLIDARELYGFPHPSVADRYWFVKRWAAASDEKVVLSFIQRPEMIDPGQIGVTMAANAGLTAYVTDNEPDALRWLLANVAVEKR